MIKTVFTRSIILRLKEGSSKTTPLYILKLDPTSDRNRDLPYSGRALANHYTIKVLIADIKSIISISCDLFSFLRAYSNDLQLTEITFLSGDQLATLYLLSLRLSLYFLIWRSVSYIVSAFIETGFVLSYLEIS